MSPTKRSFGAIRRLPSKRYQASYIGPDMARHRAPGTFPSKIDAEGWLVLSGVGMSFKPRQNCLHLAPVSPSGACNEETGTEGPVTRQLPRRLPQVRILWPKECDQSRHRRLVNRVMGDSQRGGARPSAGLFSW